jgi:hypothetical protein
MSQSWEALKRRFRQALGSRAGAGLDPEAVKAMARGIMTTRGDELGCAECFALLDEFVEMELAGRKAAEAMPLVEDHLQRCGDCKEEFEALLRAVEAMG